MPEQAHMKIKGPQRLIEALIESLKSEYVVVLTSAIKHFPGEEPHVFLTILEIPQ